MRVVAVGEAMVEMAPTAEAGRYLKSYAGDTFNTAWYLAWLRPDWAVDYVTCIGQDAISDGFVEFAAQAGIGTAGVCRHPDRTMGLYLIALKDGERSFQYWRAQSAARRLADDPDRLAATLQGADVAAFSGITLAILGDEGRGTLLDVLAKARAAGTRIVFDPNLRPRLWDSVDEMRGAVMEAARTADIVLPSFDEEALHFGDAEPADTVARYRAAGCDTVIVKNAGGPVLVSYAGRVAQVIPDRLQQVTDTTAAGDSFNAGFLAAYLDGAPVDVAVQRASAVARQVIQHRGALVPISPEAAVK